MSHLQAFTGKYSDEDKLTKCISWILVYFTRIIYPGTKLGHVKHSEHFEAIQDHDVVFIHKTSIWKCSVNTFHRRYKGHVSSRKHSQIIAIKELKLPMLKHSRATSMKYSIILARCFFFTGCTEKEKESYPTCGHNRCSKVSMKE